MHTKVLLPWPHKDNPSTHSLSPRLVYRLVPLCHFYISRINPMLIRNNIEAGVGANLACKRCCFSGRTGPVNMPRLEGKTMGAV